MSEKLLRDNYKRLPENLIQNGLFCCWQFEERNGNKTKVPYCPMDGKRAKSNDEKCFAAFDQALTGLEKHGFDGIGIGIFHGICAIDLDHCINRNGKVTKQAEEIIRLMHSYTEVSPSGDGIHILFTVSDYSYDSEKYYIMNHDVGIEVYVSGATNKYVTVTGKGHKDILEFGDRTRELGILLDRYMVRSEKKVNVQIPAINAINAGKSPDDDELLQIAMNSKNGNAFSELWNGNISPYQSHSEADMALCSHLAFWTGCDAMAMDRLFRRSGLMRKKWDEKRAGKTYGEITIDRTIKACDAMYTPTQERQIGESPPKQEVNALTKKQNSKADTAKRFPDIIPFEPEKSKLPRFPVECLPKVLGDYVNAVAEHSQTTPDMAAVVGLGVLASCLQGKFQIEGTPGYTEQLSLFVVVIASPGERKSSVLRDMTSCIAEYEKAENETLEPKIRENKKERAALERRIASLEKRLEKKAENAVEIELSSLQDRLEELPELKQVRYCADDCSIEALTSLLANNNGRMTVISAEGGIFDTIAGRYSNKPNLDVWLKGHCGDTIRVDRLGREAEYIPNPALTAILSIQPSVLKEIMSNSVMAGRGLIARFLYSSPPSRIGKRVFCTPPVPAKMETAYKEKIYQLMALPVVDQAETIRLSDEAKELISTYFLEHEKYLLEEGQDISDWANKYIGSILRIAALIHLAEYGPESSDVSADTLDNAIKIGQYFLEHARYAYALMEKDEDIKKAKFILRKIRQNGFTRGKRSELFQMCRSRHFGKTEDIFPILELLEKHGYIRQEQPDYAGVGRHPDVIVVVNSDTFVDEQSQERLAD